MIYPETMTFGLELEVGDLPRALDPPPELGSWEHSETDVVNLIPPYRHRCCDPLGLVPPVGGEINVTPARTPEALAEKAKAILDWYRDRGYEPTSNCISHTHVHVRTPGLRGDIRLLRQLTQYIRQHIDQVLADAHRFESHPDMEKVKKARTYLKQDGARKMPPWMTQNILDRAQDFDDFIRIQCCGKDGVSRGRPFRYAINTYCLKHIDTVEFRMFRHTLDPHQIEDCVRYAREFMIRALTDPTSPPPDGRTFNLPPMTFDLEQCRGWEQTKYSSDRGQKRRTLIDL